MNTRRSGVLPMLAMELDTGSQFWGDMGMWQLESLEINGGFLPGLKLKLPPGLTCIIGPRGSGKSTLAELIRFALLGTAGSTKTRTELLQANLGQSGLVSTTVIG